MEFSHNDEVKLLVDEIIQDGNLQKLAFNSSASWILPTILRSKEQMHLRIVARWCIRNLGSLMVNKIAVNLIISLLERLVGEFVTFISILLSTSITLPQS